MAGMVICFSEVVSKLKKMSNWKRNKIVVSILPTIDKNMLDEKDFNTINEIIKKYEDKNNG